MDSVNSKLSVLIIADGDAGLTGKAKKARDLGIRILEISSVKKELALL